MVGLAVIEWPNRVGRFYIFVTLTSAFLWTFPALIDGGFWVIGFLAQAALAPILVMKFHRKARLETRSDQLVFCEGAMAIDKADIEKIYTRQDAGEKRCQYILNTHRRHLSWLPGIAFACGRNVMFRVEGDEARLFVDEFEKWLEHPERNASGQRRTS